MTFKLTWPLAGAVAASTAYDPQNNSFDLTVPPGTPIRAVMGGSVPVAQASELTITAPGVIVTYSGLQTISVQAGQQTAAGAVIGAAGPDGRVRLRVYQPIDPTTLFEKPAPPTAVSTVSAPADQPVYLTPTLEGLRIREAPVDGKPLGQLKLDERVESLEPVEITKNKVGVEGQWLRIRRADGTEAYTAAWLLKVSAPPVFSPPSASLLGMNLDIFHPQGQPDPALMQGIGWVRLKFNVSFNPDNRTYGNRDIEAAYRRYRPVMERYAQAGMKILMVFTHQLYGEGAGFNWTQMDSGRWRQLVPTYAEFARQVAARFSGSGLVHCYQIWNEQDTRPEHARAAVPVPANDYGYMLTETIRAIRQADQTTPIITGGHTTGPGPGSAYARATLNAMPPDIRPDGIAFHPYGRGVKGHRFSNWGPLSEEIEAYGSVLPGRPLWITEWGVLDHQGRADVIPDVSDYASGFMNILKKDYPGRVAAAIWYAWADSMDNGFGLVDASGKPKPTFYEKCRTLG